MSNYRLPAEWERQCAVQLTWPHKATDWSPMLDEITAVYIEMAREIARRERLIIVCNDSPELLKTLLKKRLDAEMLGNITFAQCATNDTWARDHGFLTLVAPTLQPLLLDFRFNGWGDKFPSELDNAINRRLYDGGVVGGIYENHLDFVLEGGSIESDGRGTVFTTSQCLLAPNRNQPLTQAEIEAQLKRRLRADRIVWLDHGRLIGDDTDGHIDTIVRLAPGDTLLYIGCEDDRDEQFSDFLALEMQLKALRTTDGRPYRLLKLPMTDAVFDDGERLPATHANFLVINNAVLVPTYNQPAKDAEAMRIIGKAFPDREIIGIDSRPIIRQHGSIHCCTMQFPEAE
ncbi:MAG: agmatine deiminase family protein [Prevotella sp.]|nr:agmatine deiminase family protein [Prevotella sp.]